MSIMRIIRKSIFLFELGAGIALFSQGKNKQAAKGEKVKQATLGCALQETSVQKLLASDTICWEIIRWAFWYCFFFKHSRLIELLISWSLQTKDVKFRFSRELWIRQDEIRHLSFCLLVNKGMRVVTLTLLQDAFLCGVYTSFNILKGNKTSSHVVCLPWQLLEWRLCSLYLCVFLCCYILALVLDFKCYFLKLQI